MKSILTFLILLALLPFAALSQYSAGYKVRTVVIDPGHGGDDPGAVSGDTYEKDITLAIALKLGGYISQNFPDIKVLYTRKTDEKVALRRRAQIANNANADLFISVHINSSANKNAYGTNTFYFGKNNSIEAKTVSYAENLAVKFEANYLATYGDIEILKDADFVEYSNPMYADQGKKLASLIQSQMELRARRHNRGAESANFLVLRETNMPSVLVECGFISNKDELSFMLTDNGQAVLASAIYRAFRDFAQPSSDLCFRVQVMSSSKKVAVADTPSLQGIGAVSELYMDGAYKYVVGCETDYNKIRELQKKIAKKVPGSFIIAVQNGKKIDVSVAKNLLGQ